MKLKAILAATLAIAGTAAFAFDEKTVSPGQTQGNVTVASKGQDVRPVLFDLFGQANKSFVLEPDIHFVLYLSLKDVPFDEALAIVLKMANLESEKQNGIYFISKAKKAAPIPQPQGTVKPLPKPVGKLTAEEMKKSVSTKLAKTNIREVFLSFTTQTGIVIEVDSSVPEYKIDAYLMDTSIKYALDVITKAAKLTYTLTDNKSIRISKAK